MPKGITLNLVELGLGFDKNHPMEILYMIFWEVQVNTGIKFDL